jgi:hypothetical protein
MMLDSVPYREIIESLGEDGKDLTENCLSSWKAGGYKDFLQELRVLDQHRLRHELTLDLVREDQGIGSFQAAHKLSAALICEVVAEAGADTLRQAFKANPLNFLRVLNSLSRLTNGGLKCERHLADETDRKAAAEARKQPQGKRGLSPEAVAELNEKLNLM